MGKQLRCRATSFEMVLEGEWRKRQRESSRVDSRGENGKQSGLKTNKDIITHKQ